jgi:hypothetical protein
MVKRFSWSSPKLSWVHVKHINSSTKRPRGSREHLTRRRRAPDRNMLMLTTTRYTRGHVPWAIWRSEIWLWPPFMKTDKHSSHDRLVLSGEGRPQMCFSIPSCLFELSHGDEGGYTSHPHMIMPLVPCEDCQGQQSAGKSLTSGTLSTNTCRAALGFATRRSACGHASLTVTRAEDERSASGRKDARTTHT